MCLVSYVPMGEGFILTSNRDESPLRTTTNIGKENIDSLRIIFPTDIKGGSWISASSLGNAYCVLNGAFKKHKHTPPYRLSRGHMLKESFTYAGPVDFIEYYDFYGIEPFTMILTSHNKLIEFRWDGQIKYIEKMDPERIYVWSSSTLYTKETQALREQWFFRDLQINQINPDHLFHLHRYSGQKDEENGFIMNRNNVVMTISITQVATEGKNITLRHLDLISKEERKEMLEINE